MVLENCSYHCPTSSLPDSDCSDYSSRTTIKYLERIFEKNNFKFVLLDSSEANMFCYKYDWKITNSKQIYYLRIIYVAYK
jgi:hypothetical protein